MSIFTFLSPLTYCHSKCFQIIINHLSVMVVFPVFREKQHNFGVKNLDCHKNAIRFETFQKGKWGTIQRCNQLAIEDLKWRISQWRSPRSPRSSKCFVEMFQAKPMGTTQSLLKRVVRDATGEVGRLEQENPVIFCDCLPRNSQIAICVAIVLAKHTMVLHMGCSAYWWKYCRGDTGGSLKRCEVEVAWKRRNSTQGKLDLTYNWSWTHLSSWSNRLNQTYPQSFQKFRQLMAIHCTKLGCFGSVGGGLSAPASCFARRSVKPHFLHLERCTWNEVCGGHGCVPKAMWSLMIDCQ